MKILLPQDYCFLRGIITSIWCVGWSWGSREADGRVEVVVVSLYDSKILIVVLYDCNQQTNDWSEPCKYPGSSTDQWWLSVLSLGSGHLTGYHRTILQHHQQHQLQTYVTWRGEISGIFLLTPAMNELKLIRNPTVRQSLICGCGGFEEYRDVHLVNVRNQARMSYLASRPRPGQPLGMLRKV